MRIITEQQDYAYAFWNKEVEEEFQTLSFATWYPRYCNENGLFDDRTSEQFENLKE